MDQQLLASLVALSPGELRRLASENDVIDYATKSRPELIMGLLNAHDAKPSLSIVKNPYLLADVAKHLSSRELNSLLTAIEGVSVSGTSPIIKELVKEKALPILTDWLNRLPYRNTLTPEQVFEMTRLKLDGIKLTRLPESIGHLTNLKYLLLDDNKLKVLPETIWHLGNLEQLGVSENKLSALPEAIGKLNKLVVLWLHDNKLTSLPRTIGDLTNLKELTLNDNKIASLPREIGALDLDYIDSQYEKEYRELRKKYIDQLE